MTIEPLSASNETEQLWAQGNPTHTAPDSNPIN